MRPPFSGRIGIIEAWRSLTRRRGRPRGGRRGSRGRGRLGRHSGGRRARGGFFLRRRGGLASCHGRRGSRRQFNEHRVRHEPRRSQFAFGVGVARVVRRHHPHRDGLRLIARKGEAHGELVGSNCERAGGPASLPGRGPGLGSGRLGFELHARRRRRRFHEAWRL